jgi:hypothetical protein
MKAITYQTKLESDIIQLSNAKDFIGKDVIISIIELPAIVPKKKERKWNFLGAVKLDKQLDNINIRDLAYE